MALKVVSITAPGVTEVREDRVFYHRCDDVSRLKGFEGHYHDPYFPRDAAYILYAVEAEDGGE
jgi:hypothetical protein